MHPNMQINWLHGGRRFVPGPPPDVASAGCRFAQRHGCHNDGVGTTWLPQRPRSDENPQVTCLIPVPGASVTMSRGPARRTHGRVSPQARDALEQGGRQARGSSCGDRVSQRRVLGTGAGGLNTAIVTQLTARGASESAQSRCRNDPVALGS